MSQDKVKITSKIKFSKKLPTQTTQNKYSYKPQPQTANELKQEEQNIQEPQIQLNSPQKQTAETPMPPAPKISPAEMKILVNQYNTNAPISPPVPASLSSPPPPPFVSSSAKEMAPVATKMPPPTPINKSKTIFADKTNIIQGKVLKIEDEVDAYKDQLHNYLEFCDCINRTDWTVSDIIDNLYILIESLNIDVVALAIIDFSEKNKLCKILTRGFKEFAEDDITCIWNGAIMEGPSINWNNLMMIAANTHSHLAKWIVKEGLDSIGYVPVHDNKTIYGFMFIGTHHKKNQSPLASSILELCGSRIGLVLALRKALGHWPVKA